MRCLWQVEIDDYCSHVLAKHWPNVERFGDVRECGRHNLAAVDVLCGGFPCQPFSQAGKQRGEQDDRNLWPEMRRVIAELRPRWVVAENVPGIRNIYLDTILSDLEGLDYTPTTVDLPAVAFGAPHIRHRLFVVAHTKGTGWAQNGERESGRYLEQREPASMAHANSRRFQECTQLDGEPQQAATDGDSQRQYIDRCGDAVAYPTSEQRSKSETRNGGQVPTRRSEENNRHDNWFIEPNVGRVVDGIPARVDRLRTLGNAVVPQVAEWLGRRIVEVEAGAKGTRADV